MSAALAQREAVREPRAIGGREAVVELLARRGLPASEPILDFEARYGGVRFARRRFTHVQVEEGVNDFVLGPYALLERDAATPGRERALVPIVLAPNDVWYLLDEDGEAWAEDVIEDPEPVPFARSATCALAKLVLYERMFDDRHEGGGLTLDGHVGRALAERFALPPIEEASDQHARFWGDARTLVVEHDDAEGEPATMVTSLDPERLAGLNAGACDRA